MMTSFKIGSSEAKFADLIWSNEPVTSSELARLGGEIFDWKKTTSFTVLKRLCDRGIFQNKSGIVTSLISRQDYYAHHTEQCIDYAFGGSLPAFLAAFGPGTSSATRRSRS